MKLKNRPHYSSLIDQEMEYDWLMNVGREKDFVFLERIRWTVNILEGLEFHTRVFGAAKFEVIVNYVYMLNEMESKTNLRIVHILNQHSE